MAFQSTFAAPCTQEGSTLWKVLGWAERLAAALLLAALTPVLVGTAMLIWRLGRRPPLVAHWRVGQYGQPFWTLKLRTMWSGKDAWRSGLVERIVEEPGPETKREQDPRVTSRLARWLRRFSVDELPQLVNVVRGEMALVGPRPLTREELRTHYGADAPEVLSVRPGMTGLWQVKGRSRLSYPARRELDLVFVRRRSLPMYAAILLRTLPEVLTGRNAW